MGNRHADWMFGDSRSMVIGAMGTWNTGNRLSSFCQPVIPIYIVDFDPDFDFDKPEFNAIALSGPCNARTNGSETDGVPYRRFALPFVTFFHTTDP
ncbi:hypothetical protein [Desulfosarcina ovata]|uniref:hypothetical protein n=1 Tax=Desulfosarcina ovata TaxID=83564 RepID=UPI0012D2F81F|nr:hypothetical protein [Desulfosarcina ovata]